MQKHIQKISPRRTHPKKASPKREGQIFPIPEEVLLVPGQMPMDVEAAPVGPLFQQGEEKAVHPPAQHMREIEEQISESSVCRQIKNALHAALPTIKKIPIVTMATSVGGGGGSYFFGANVGQGLVAGGLIGCSISSLLACSIFSLHVCTKNSAENQDVEVVVNANASLNEEEIQQFAQMQNFSNIS